MMEAAYTRQQQQQQQQQRFPSLLVLENTVIFPQVHARDNSISSKVILITHIIHSQRKQQQRAGSSSSTVHRVVSREMSKLTSSSMCRNWQQLTQQHRQRSRQHQTAVAGAEESVRVEGKLQYLLTIPHYDHPPLVASLDTYL